MPELLGRTIEERAKVDMLQVIIWDLKKVSTLGCFLRTDKVAWAKETLTKCHDVAEYLKRAEGPFLIGEQLCYLDFYLFELL